MKTISSWREEFTNRFYEVDQETGGVWCNNPAVPKIEQFIENEIIEKLIEEIPNAPYDLPTDAIKDQLRAKWLGKEDNA